MTEAITEPARTDTLPPLTRQSDSRIGFLLRCIDREKLAPGAEVLNVGNLGPEDGSGLSTDSVRARLAERGLSMIGCDIQAPPPGSGPDQVQGDVHDMPFEDGRFAVVYLGEVIEHTWTPLAALQEVGRVLRPGGLMVLDTPNVYKFSDIVAWTMLGRNNVGAADHKILYTPSMMSKLLREAQFEPIDLTTDRKYALKGVKFPRRMPLFSRMGAHLLCSARNMRGQ